MSAQSRKNQLNPFYIEPGSYDDWDDYDDDEDEEELGLLVGRHDTHQSHYSNSRGGIQRYERSSNSQTLCRRRVFWVSGLAFLLLLVLMSLGGESQGSSSVAENDIKNNTHNPPSSVESTAAPGSGKENTSDNEADIPTDESKPTVHPSDNANDQAASSNATASPATIMPSDTEAVDAASSNFTASSNATAAPRSESVPPQSNTFGIGTASPTLPTAVPANSVNEQITNNTVNISDEEQSSDPTTIPSSVTATNQTKPEGLEETQSTISPVPASNTTNEIVENLLQDTNFSHSTMQPTNGNLTR